MFTSVPARMREYIGRMPPALFSPLLDLARQLPGQCALCHAWPARPLCQACVARFVQSRPRCLTCALPLPSGQTQCGACLRRAPPLDACHALADYRFPWSNLITRLKFGDQPGWAGTLARLLQQSEAARTLLEQACWVLPIPLSLQRLRQRGYNQTVELGRRLATARLRTDLLLRTGHGPAQSALPRARRLANVRHAFMIEPLRQHELCDRRVVLLDDVMTSGATLFAAAQVVREAGAAHVSALVLARTE